VVGTASNNLVYMDSCVPDDSREHFAPDNPNGTAIVFQNYATGLNLTAGSYDNGSPLDCEGGPANMRNQWGFS
jgi:hypothetical protein